MAGRRTPTARTWKYLAQPTCTWLKARKRKKGSARWSSIHCTDRAAYWTQPRTRTGATLSTHASETASVRANLLRQRMNVHWLLNCDTKQQELFFMHASIRVTEVRTHRSDRSPATEAGCSQDSCNPLQWPHGHLKTGHQSRSQSRDCEAGTSRVGRDAICQSPPLRTQHLLEHRLTLDSGQSSGG